MDGESNQHKWTHPASTEEVADLIRSACADSIRLRICGHEPMALEASGVGCMALDRMADVIDYPARDMTITVQAGMPIATLASVLAVENQQLPIDVFDCGTTVGAAVAGNVAGPRQFGYGTLRDYVIGIEGVDGQARVFHSGGRVVKNVAGYDLCRLMVGSRGALGVLTQVTFKLKPIPDHSMLRTFRFSDAAQLESALDRLNTSAANPVILDYTFAPGSKELQSSVSTDNLAVPYSLHLGVEGTESSCEWQIEQLKNECEGGEEVHFDGQEAASVAQHCRSWGYGWSEPMIICLPSKVIPVSSDLADRGYSTVGHAGNGKVFVLDNGSSQKIREVCDDVTALHGGTVTEWDQDHPAQRTSPYSSRLRAAFDPNGVFTR